MQWSSASTAASAGTNQSTNAHAVSMWAGLRWKISTRACGAAFVNASFRTAGSASPVSPQLTCVP